MLQLSKRFPIHMRTWLTPALCLLVVGALAAIFLFDVAISQVLLVILVLACPLRHLMLGHGGHAEHGSHRHDMTAAPPTPSMSDVPPYASVLSKQG